MKKSERQRLGAYIAELKYGRGSTRENSFLADRMLIDFPCIHEEYQVLADLEAAGNLINSLNIFICEGIGNNRYVVDQAKRTLLYDNLWAIAGEFDDWCQNEGTSPTQLFEDGVDNNSLYANASLKRHMVAAAIENSELELFASSLGLNL